MQKKFLVVCGRMQKRSEQELSSFFNDSTIPLFVSLEKGPQPGPSVGPFLPGLIDGNGERDGNFFMVESTEAPQFYDLRSDWIFFCQFFYLIIYIFAVNA